MVAAERRAQLPVNGLELGRNQHGAHRESVADALGHGNQIGLHTQILMSKKLARTPISALDFIANQHRARFVACLTQALHELRRGQADAAHALDALHNDGTHTTLRQFCLESLQVIQGQISHMAVRIDRRDDFRIVRHLHGQRRAPVERPFGRKHPAAPVMETGQLQSILVSLGSGINQKQLVILITAGLPQPSGQLHLQFVDDGVAIEAQ